MLLPLSILRFHSATSHILWQWLKLSLFVLLRMLPDQNEATSLFSYLQNFVALLAAWKVRKWSGVVFFISAFSVIVLMGNRGFQFLEPESCHRM
jgi:hypothetical protein